MKKALLLALIISLSGNIFAQKNVNIDSYRFSYTERNMPQVKIEPIFFYYAKRINLPGTMRSYVNENQLYDNLIIEGQRETNKPERNDVIVTVTMGAINILKSDIKERMIESKKKDGTTIRSYRYWLEVAYTFESYAVVTQEGRKIGQYTMNYRSQQIVFKSGEYDSRKGVSNYWNNNKEVLREEFSMRSANDAINSLSPILSRNFGFPLAKKTNVIKTINEKKHPENDDLRAMSTRLKGNLERMDGQTPMKEEDIQEIITYFKEIPERYSDPSSKLDMRLRYVAFYNLCMIYLYLDQPERVEPWAQRLYQNGHDKKDGEKLNKEAEKLIIQLDRLGTNTRQFNPDDYFGN